jgi:betaine-aldehyde dehydrogenase
MDRSWLMTRRDPYGVVGRIIAYNHPIMFAATKIGGPVVMGNTLVLKAPDQAPLSTLLMGEIIREVFPTGVVNLITGTGVVTGDALVRHPDVKRLTLVGSVPTGQRVQAAAATAGVKHVSLELGGKNPMIVCPDADLDAVVEGAASGMNCHWCQGQSCGSITRLFLHEDIHDEILDRLVERLRTITIGDPLDPATQMGCLVSQQQYDKVTGYIQAGKDDGARLVTGCGRPAGAAFEQGHFIEPTALAYRPEILLMDEPFASVDAQTRSDLEDLVLRVRHEFDVTILFVTHDIDESVYLSDRIVVLTPSPTEVKEILPVELPRPRDQIETKELPDFARMRAHVYRLIKRELRDATAAGVHS